MAYEYCVLEFSMDMADPSADYDQFTVYDSYSLTYDSVTAAALGPASAISNQGYDSDDYIVLTMASNDDPDDGLTVTYTPGTVRSANGGILAYFQVSTDDQ